MNVFQIKDAVVFVTGANRGIGKAFVEVALEQGASKVYAASRDASNLGELAEHDAVVAIELDVTNQEQIRRAAESAQDVTLLVNNAGVAAPTSFLAAENIDAGRFELEVNYFGTWNMALHFAPILIKNQGAMANINSISSWVNWTSIATYSASKAAAHSLTQGLRNELGSKGVLVSGVYPGPIETDLTAGMEMEKATPQEVALKTYREMAEGKEDIFSDPFAESFISNYSRDWKAVEHQIRDMVNLDSE